MLETESARAQMMDRHSAQINERSSERNARAGCMGSERNAFLIATLLAYRLALGRCERSS